MLSRNDILLFVSLITFAVGTTSTTTSTPSTARSRNGCNILSSMNDTATTRDVQFRRKNNTIPTSTPTAAAGTATRRTSRTTTNARPSTVTSKTNHKIAARYPGGVKWKSDKDIYLDSYYQQDAYDHYEYESESDDDEYESDDDDDDEFDAWEWEEDEDDQFCYVLLWEEETPDPWSFEDAIIRIDDDINADHNDATVCYFDEEDIEDEFWDDIVSYSDDDFDLIYEDYLDYLDMIHGGSWADDDDDSEDFLVDDDGEMDYEFVIGRSMMQQQQQRDVLPKSQVDFAQPQKWSNDQGSNGYYQTVRQQPHFLLPKQIPPGKVAPIRWRDTHEIISDEEIFSVGLPPKLLTEFRSYFDANGMLDVVHQLLYANNSTESKQSEEGRAWTMKDGHKWSVKHADHWDSDMVWFDPIDETCYEGLRSVLRRGDFDMVVEAVRKQLGLPNPGDLVVHGMGAIFLSRFVADEHLHLDVPETRGAFYNILVPIYLPEDDVASLYIGGDDGFCSPIHLQYNVATVIGSDSWHGTGECDYRSSKGFRLSMSIWVSEITERNIQVISTDGFSPWPLNGDLAWYRAQKGRTLTRNDRGRAPLPPLRDQRNDCHRVKDQCETDLWGVRFQCPKTCHVYMADLEYYSYVNELKVQETSVIKHQRWH